MTHSITLRPADLAPLQDWFHDLRARVDGWSKQWKASSTHEWNALHQTLSGALSTQRMETALRDFLARMGISRTAADDAVDEAMRDFRRRVVKFRSGQTIESYERYLVRPPTIEL